MYSRPGTEDTESDLLRFQEEFLTGRLSPSATVFRSNKEGQTRSPLAGDKRGLSGGPHPVTPVERDIVTLEGLPAVQQTNLLDHDLPPKKRSKFKTRHQNSHRKKEQDSEEEMDCAELLDTHDRHVTSVLSQIRERDIQYGHSAMAPKVSLRGFPMALHRGNIDEQRASISKGNKTEGKKSLFAQQFAASGGVTFGVPEQDIDNVRLSAEGTKVVKMASDAAVHFPRSSVISGEGLFGSAGEKILLNQAVDEIHNENVAKLESMTQDEILEEQARIKASLDPSVVAFLTSQHKSNKETMGTETKSVDEKKNGFHSNITHHKMEEETGLIDKHVHFSEDVQIIEQENEQKMTEQDQQGQADDCITVGDLKVSSKWLHMDAVETEKMKWMKDCPAPSALDSKEGNQARFDFRGRLVSRTDNIPEYVGLHHHGNDPSLPGYTLEELFVLARSSFLQQRVFALQVLARIIRQDWLNAFQGHLSDDLLSVLLDAGILVLLRWALDDTSEAVMTAAVQGFASVLVVPSEKEAADKLFSFPNGYEFPALCPVTEKKEENRFHEKDEEERKLTDAELLKQDVVKGLIQMSILPRLRYILEVCSPAAPTVNDILDILTRMSQHSTQAASEVLKCPRLMETIFANFLPLSWKIINMSSGTVCDQPMSLAMRLVRTLCCAGRHVAAVLISKYNLLDRVMRYTALSPNNTQMAIEEAYLLYIDSLRTWRVCVLYGLGCEVVREMYSFFIEHLQLMQRLSILPKTVDEKAELSCSTAIFGIIEAAIYAAGSATDQKIQENASSPERHLGTDSLPPLALNWSHVTGFLPLIGGCVTKWMKEIMVCENQVLESENLCLLSGAVAALKAFYSKLPDQASHSPMDTLQQLEQLTTTLLLPLINSEVIDWCFTQISSSYSNRGPSKSRKAIPSFPGYGSVELLVKPGTQSAKPSISEVIGFTSSVVQLLGQVTKLHKGVATKFSPILRKEAILKYLKLVVESMDLPVCFFSRHEHHLQYFLLKLAFNLVQVAELDAFPSCIPLWHEVALLLFSKILPGDECYAFDLVSTVLFNSKFLCGNKSPSSVDVTKDLSEMSLATNPMPSTYDTATASRGELIAEAHKNLPSLRSMFVTFFQGRKRALDVSKSLAVHEVRNIQSFLVPVCTGPLQPADWMFLPIVELYNQTISVEMKGKEVDSITDHDVSLVTATLQLVLMLEELRPSCLRHVSLSSRIARLMCVFMTGNDTFLNAKVHDYLSVLLRNYTSPSKLSELDFNSPVPGLTSFYDLYAALLSQFSAVSFGDPLFSCFVILPLTQKHDIKFRRAVWDEHIGVLRALSIPLGQLLIPLDDFLYPVEQNQSLLGLYLRALATQAVRPQWSPLLYLVAVHHVNAFVFQRVDAEDEGALKNKIAFLKQVLCVQNEDVRHDILHYFKPSTSSPLALPFEKFTNLPADRQLLLRNRDSLEDYRQIYRTMMSA